jgi:hypothetical protein
MARAYVQHVEVCGCNSNDAGIREYMAVSKFCRICQVIGNVELVLSGVCNPRLRLLVCDVLLHDVDNLY